MNLTTSETNEEVRYVGFWARFLAFLIDSVWTLFLMALLVFYLIGKAPPGAYDLQDPVQLMNLLNSFALELRMAELALAAIFVGFWILRSATPGKMVISCSIVDAKTLGKVGSLKNIVRYLGYFVSLLPFGMGFLWIAFDSRKQGWHDKIAGTLVIKGRPRKNGSGT